MYIVGLLPLERSKGLPYYLVMTDVWRVKSISNVPEDDDLLAADSEHKASYTLIHLSGLHRYYHSFLEGDRAS